VFGKLFNFGKTPKNDGNSAEFEEQEGKSVKVFDLELSNMEGAPTYRLSHQLSVGSEIGNIVIADESISPRHATFVLQQNIISLIDHASLSGTFVNDKKIPPGKYIILDESDEIKIGDLVLKIKTSYEKVLEDNLEDVQLDQGSGREEVAEDISEEEVDDESEVESQEEKPIHPSKIKIMFQKLKNVFSFKKKAPSKARIDVGVVASSYSANALMRVIAVSMDLLFSYGLMIILSPFDDFKNLLTYVPDQIDELIGVKLIDMWTELTADFEGVREIVNELIGFVDGVVPIWPLMFLFGSIRLLSTLVFGVSLSEFLVGIKAAGNGVWARIGGVIRVLIGFITGPFIIFDVPAIVSRKTFKEFLTFTQIQLRSKWISLFGVILFLPLALGFVLVAPLLQGFEPPESFVVSDLVERRIKIQKTDEALPAEESLSSDVVQSSKFLNLEMTYDPQNLLLSPEIRFKGMGKKLAFTPFVNFYLKDLQRMVRLELMKTFSFQKFLGIGIKGNFFLYDKLPEIYGFVYQPEGEVSKILTREGDQGSAKFSQEFMTFFKMAMELGLENFPEVMETQTPLLQGLIEFKGSFLSLIESRDFTDIGFIKLGNLQFLKVSYVTQTPYDLLIPLHKGEGRVYKVEFDGRENLKDVSSKFYKYHLEKANWLSPKVVEKNEVPNAFEIVDSLSSIVDVKKDFTIEKAQGLFSYFFEGSGKVLSSPILGEQEMWKKSLSSVLKLVETLAPVNQNTEEPVEEDPVLKLKEKFTQLSDAFEAKNFEYFGVSSPVITNPNP
jgi:hypothetical protein